MKKASKASGWFPYTPSNSQTALVYNTPLETGVYTMYIVVFVCVDALGKIYTCMF